MKDDLEWRAGERHAVTRLTTQAIDPPRSAPRSDEDLLSLALMPPQRPAAAAVRAFDLLFAVVATIVAAPIMLVIAALLAAFHGRPVVYSQTRVGRCGHEFRLLKFRTMVRDADARLAELLANDREAAEEFRTMRKLRTDPRVHRLGNVIRKLKLDELPQLWNVLKGEMSVVGPRPVPASEARRYGPYGQIAFSIRPGLTGPWQVGCVDPTDYEERVKIDVKFAQSHSFLDIVRLTVLTPFSILTSRRTEFV